MFGGFSSKNPITSFAPPATPPAPRTPSEWKASLLEVKSLYLERQYKQCAAHSTEILKRATEPIHPVYKTYLNFYAAISYEFLGRAAHLYSRNKIALLHAALDYFVDCGADLPATIPLPKLPMAEASPILSPYPTPPSTPPLLAGPGPSTPEECLLWFDAGKYETPGHDSLIQSMTRMIDLALIHPADDPFVSDSDTEPQTPFMQTLSKLSTNTPTAGMKEHHLVFSPIKPIASTTDPAKRDPLMPSPLRIRKKADGLTEDGTKCADDSEPQKQAPTRPRPPPLPLKIIPANELNVIRSQKSHATANPLNGKGVVSRVMETPSLTSSHERKNNSNEDNTTDVNPARAAQIVRFNRGIEFLREQVKSNITEIQQHVDHVEEIQRARRSRKMQRAVSFWSFSPVKDEEGAEEKKQTQEPVMDQFGNILVGETKLQRISRLRAEGWNTVGLRSPRSTWKGARYYQEFCNMVLNELCLDK